MKDLIQRAKKIQEQKKENTPKKQRIGFKRFLSFIDREPSKKKFNVLEVTRSTSISKIGEDAIQDFRDLIELAKAASEEQDSEMADLFYELKGLKEQEIGIIYNYITKHR